MSDEAQFAVGFTARVLPAEGPIAKGDALVFDPDYVVDGVTGAWRIATAAVRAELGSGAEAIALGDYGAAIVGTVSYQAAGLLSKAVSGLGTDASAKLVRVSSTGRLERISSYTSGDDVVGYAQPNGRVKLHIGLPWDMIAALAGGFTAGGDLTGDATTQTVAKIQGVAISGTAASGKTLVASGAAAASWQTPSSGASPAGVAGDIQVKQDATTFNVVGFWKAVDNAGTLRATYWDDSDGFTERAGIQFSAGTFNDPQVFPDYGLIRVSSFFYSFAGGHLITLVKPDNTTEWSLLAVAGAEFFVGDPSFVIPTILSGNGITIAPGTAGASISGNLAVNGTLTLSNPLAGGSVAAATTSTAGSMSAADKTKLDGMQSEGSAVAVAAMAIDWSAGSVFTKTLAAGANTFTFSNATSGRMITVRVTGAASTLTWPTVKWAGGVAPTQTASGTDIYTFVHDGTNIYGTVVQAMA